VTKPTYTEDLIHAIRSLMTEEQLSAPLPGRNGITTRMLLCSVRQDMLEARPSREGQIKAYWHPGGVIGTRKFNAEWRPLVLGDEINSPRS
jgi:hypothetical protein